MLILAWLVLWLRYRLFPPLPRPLDLDVLMRNARKNHPEQFEDIDFAAWEMQMEDKL